MKDNDLTLIEKIADSLYKNKEFLKASKYYEKLEIMINMLIKTWSLELLR